MVKLMTISLAYIANKSETRQCIGTASEKSTTFQFYPCSAKCSECRISDFTLYNRIILYLLLFVTLSTFVPNLIYFHFLKAMRRID